MTSEAQRGREYERWMSRGGVSASVLRWAMTPAGQWAVNTPLMRLVENLKVSANQRWLDIGCGRGSLLRFTDQRVGFTHRPVGIDFSRSVLRLAQQDEDEAGQSIALAQATATALPFAEGTFDLVTCGYVVKHLTDAELDAFFAEVGRVLAGGGLALVWEFAPTRSERLNAWNRRWLSAGVREPELRSTSTLRAHARATGFEFTREARLRPFMLPPIPRASILIGKPPEGWQARD